MGTVFSETKAGSLKATSSVTALFCCALTEVHNSTAAKANGTATSNFFIPLNFKKWFNCPHIPVCVICQKSKTLFYSEVSVSNNIMKSKNKHLHAHNLS